MGGDLFLDGKKYIGTRHASELVGYTPDHVARLCSSDEIKCQRIGKSWYAEEESVLKYKSSQGGGSLLKIENKFISVKDASFLTSYSKGYINQLCRLGLVSSKMIGRSWFVDEESLLAYKNKPTTYDFSQNLDGKKKETQVESLLFRQGLRRTGKPKYFSPTSIFKTGLTISLVTLTILLGRNITSENISSLPDATYQTLEEVVDYYSNYLGQGYLSLGEEINDKLIKTKSVSISILKNPALAIVQTTENIGRKQVALVDTTRLASRQATEKSIELVSNTHNKIFTTISGGINKLSGVKTNTPSLSASVLLSLNPLDKASISIYNKVNSWFERNVFTPTQRYFTEQTVVEPIPRDSASVLRPSASVVYTTNVVERTVERVITQNIPQTNTEDIDTKLQILNNKLQSDIAKLSSGGNTVINNVYQQIAQSQKIDQLYNTALHTPTITGGSLSGVSIGATSVSSDTLTVSGLSTLATANISTSTITTLTTTDATLTNSTTTNATTTNSYITSLTSDSGTVTNLTSTYGTTTNATSTSFFATLLQNTTGIIDTLTSTLATITGLTTTNSTTTNATTTNSYITNATIDDSTIGTITATSSISTPSLTITGTAINSLLSTNSLGIITATSTPTFGNFNATSTTATSTISGNLSIGGGTGLYLTGNGSGLTFSGTGNHDITVEGGTLRIGANTVIGNILAMDDTIDIGDVGTRFDKIYANEVNATTLVGTITGGNITSETLTLNFDNTSADTENAYFSVERGSVTPNAIFGWEATNNEFTLNSGLNITNTIGSTYGLLVNGGNVGIASSTPGYKLTVAGSAYFDGGTIITDTLTATSSISTPSLTITGTAINSLLSTDTTGIITATSTPTFGNFNATSTTATSTISTGGFAVGTSQFVIQQNSGNVGIGTMVPGTALDVAGSGTIRGASLSGVSSAGSLLLYGDREASNAVTVWDTGNLTTLGNVGIGTTVPSQKIHVAGSAQINDDIYLGAPLGVDDADTDVLIKAQSGWSALGNGRALYIEAGITDNGSAGYIGGNLYLRPGQPSAPATTYGDVIVADQGGNVGIGTTAPNQKFSVNNRFTISNDAIIRWGGAADYGTLTWDTGKAVVQGQAGKTLSLGANGTSDMLVISAGGNVGIGTTNPSVSLLQLLSTGSGFTQSKTVSGYFYSSGFSGNDPYYTYYAEAGMTIGYGSSTGGVPTVTTLRLLNNGNVGIGSLTPGTALDVVGTIRGSNGLTISAGTVSLPSGQIDNAELANSSLIITAGSGLTTGGAVSLGSSVTVNVGAGTCITSNTDDIAVTADCIGDTQLAYNTGQHLTTASSPTFAGLTTNGTLTIGGQQLYASTYHQFRTAGVAYAGIQGYDSTPTLQYWLYGDATGQGFLTDAGSWKLMIPSTAGASIMRENTYTMWDSGNDGSGTGLDADLWDGYQFSDYLNQAVKTTSSPTFVTPTVTTLSFAGGSSITTDGMARINLNATGYTYIPSGIFYVEGLSNLRGGIANDNAAYLTIAGGTSGYTYFSGNVGIGTTAPADKLNVVTTVAYGGLTLEATSASNYQTALNFKHPNGTTYGRIGYDNNTDSMRLMNLSTWGGAGADILFYTNNDTTTPKMTISRVGNVGIGTTAPDYPLTIRTYDSGAGRTTERDSLRLLADNGNSPYTGFGPRITLSGYVYNTGIRDFAQIAAVMGSDYNNTGDLLFRTRTSEAAGLSEKMRISGGGNVGIGTDPSSYKLQVSGTAYASTGMYAPVYYDTDSTIYYFSSQARVDTISSGSLSDTLEIGYENTGGNIALYRPMTMQAGMYIYPGSSSGINQQTDYYLYSNSSWGLQTNTSFRADGGLYDGGNRVCSGSSTAGCDSTYVNVGGDTMSGDLNFNNYGIGVVGVYSDLRYQNVFSMGASYTPLNDGTALDNMYGIAWTHSNIGGQSKAGLGHQALFLMAGQTYTAIGSGIWTDGNLTVTGNGYFTGNDIDGDGQTMLRYNDEWLRLNDDAEFSSGVYTQGLLRADGGVQVDGTWALGSDNNCHYTYGSSKYDSQCSVNSSGMSFNANDNSSLDLLIYDGGILFNAYTYYGYNGSAALYTYDTNESLVIEPNGVGYVQLSPDNTSNVGVGLTTPDTSLHVSGNVHIGTQTAFDNPGGWNKSLLLDGSIHARYRVMGSAYAAGKNSVTEANLWVDNSNGPSYAGVSSDAGLAFATNASYNFTFSGGNVGIGTTVPSSAKLQLVGNGYITGESYGGLSIGEAPTNYNGWDRQLNLHGTGNARLTVKTSTVQMGVYAHDAWVAVSGTTPGGFVGTYNNYPVSVLVNGAQRMVVDTGGNVGVGTVNPAVRLHADYSSYNIDTVRASYANNSHSAGLGVEGYATYWGAGIWQDGTLRANFENDGLAIGNTYSQYNAPASGLIVAGNVGIGTSSPGKPIHFESATDGMFRIYQTSATANVTMIEFLRPSGAAGSITCTTSNNCGYNTTSDMRLKENILETHYSLGDLMNIDVVDFNFIADENKKRVTGFIAQDLNQIYPDAVTSPTSPDGYWMVDYGRITPLLVKSIQELSTRTSALSSATTTPSIIILDNGNVGVGTSTPTSKFHVFSNSTSGGVAIFTDANASCTIDPTNASMSCTSDISLKKDIETLNASTTIEKIMALRPVSYRWNGEDTSIQGSTLSKHQGLIAQEVEGVFPEFVTTDSNGIKSISYTNLIPSMITAIQTINNRVSSIDARLTNLEQMVASSTPNQGQSLTLESVLETLRGIGVEITQNVVRVTNLVANLVTSEQVDTKKLCLDDLCVTKNQLQALLLNANVSAEVNGSETSTTPASPEATQGEHTPDTSLPVISILGDNPAILTVGTSYSDMGATVTDTGVNPLDLTGPLVPNNNLGIHLNLNGVDVTDISLDTTATSTHTIIYSAVDGAGNTGYATRTVEVILAQ